jgi:S-formylglutathione hydrolase FrmB
MALVTCRFYSEALGFRTKMEAILPQLEGRTFSAARGQPDTKYPVLYLLHGYTNDETEWTRLSTFGRFIENYPVVVVMPSLQRSTYVDIGNTHRDWTFLSDELPALAQAFFPISSRREDTFVAGLSMGGYGAFKLGLSYPDRYAAAASLAGVLDFAQVSHQDPWWQNELRFIYGEQAMLEGGPHDLFHLARQMAESPGVKTRLFASTGTEDHVYKGNLAFKQLAESLGLDFTYEEGPGIHSWEYFDPMIPRMLAWLRLHPTEE